MRRFLLALFLIVLLPGLVPAEDSAVKPQITFFSRLGEEAKVKLFNREPISFLARAEGTHGFLRGVTFFLCDPGGDPGRSETVRSRQEDGAMWGRPPSSFALPLSKRLVGPYRLHARKPGHQEGKLDIVLVEFRYVDLEFEHTKSLYRASFHLHLRDLTEKRKAIPIDVRIESLTGGLLDRIEVRLKADPQRRGLWKTHSPVKISSSVKTPARDLEGKGPLRLLPRCRLLLVLDGYEFRYPVPLAREEVKGTGGFRR